MIRYLLPTFLLFFLGCDSTPTTPKNNPPIARIVSSSNSVLIGDTVTLDASSSSDSDGRIVSYVWEDENNPTPLGTSSSLSITLTMAGEYTVYLTVKDNKGDEAKTSVPISVTKRPNTTFSTINSLIAGGNATYIMIGDSTRSYSEYHNEHVFEVVRNALNKYNVTSYNQAVTGITAAEYADISHQQNWTDIVPHISGKGDTTIVDISLGINDDEDTYEITKNNLKKIITSIRTKKPNTSFILTVPNHTLYDASWENSSDFLQMYTELASELNVPYINIPYEVMANVTIDWYRPNDQTHLDKEHQTLLADFILDKILPDF